MAASLGGCCSKLRIDGSARGVEVLVEEDVPMAVPADEELGVLEVLDAVHVAGRREEEVAVDQVVALLLGEVPDLLLAADHHQVVAERVVVRRLHAPGLEPDVRRRGALPHDPHLAAGHDPHRLELHPLPQAADGAGGVRDGGGGDVGDGGHLGGRGVEEALDVVGPGGVAGGRARGAERGGEPGVGDGGGGVGRGGQAGEREDVAGVDGAGVGGVGGGGAVSGVDAGVLVGEDGDAGARAADHDAAGLEGGVGGGGGGGDDAAGDGGGGGVVLVDAEVDDVGDGRVGAEVRDDGVLERLAEGVGGREDLEAAVCGGGGHGGWGGGCRGCGGRRGLDGSEGEARGGSRAVATSTTAAVSELSEVREATAVRRTTTTRAADYTDILSVLLWLRRVTRW